VSKLGAVVVSYNPETKVLDALLQSLEGQVDFLILADNGGGQDFLSSHPDKRERVHYIQMGGNKGLGAALNQGFALAADAGVDYLVTFDQDSAASADLIESLYKCMTTAREKDSKAVAVSPSFFDRREGDVIRFPFYRTEKKGIKPVFESDGADGLVRADTLITSGMMVSVEAWRLGMKYDEGMFVDYTDTEWCFRARSQGYSLYGSTNIQMGHALSDAPPIKLFGLSFFSYSPIRRYFYFRNTVAVAMMPHASAAWKRRLLSGLVLRFFVNLAIDKQKGRSLSMMVRGVVHALKGKLGAAQ
jgi:rhamnosyltransferase